VDLPKPHPPSLSRVALFVMLCLLGSIGLNGLRSPDLSRTYRAFIAHLVTAVLPEPSLVNNYVSHLRPVIPLSFVAFSVALAACIHATPGRRLVILLHAPLAIFAAISADAALAIVGIESGLPLKPFPLVSIVLHYLV